MVHVPIPEDTPEDFEVLPAAVYNFRIDEAPTTQMSKKGTGENLVVDLTVVDGPQENRRIRDFIFQNEMGHIKAQHLARSCGIDPSGGFDTEDLVGRVCEGVVTNSTYTDEQTGETRERANVTRYIWKK